MDMSAVEQLRFLSHCRPRTIVDLGDDVAGFEAEFFVHEGDAGRGGGSRGPPSAAGAGCGGGTGVGAGGGPAAAGPSDAFVGQSPYRAVECVPVGVSSEVEALVKRRVAGKGVVGPDRLVRLGLLREVGGVDALFGHVLGEYDRDTEEVHCLLVCFFPRWRERLAGGEGRSDFFIVKYCETFRLS